MSDLIENKLYSIAELTTLLGHSHEYIRALLVNGHLKGIRPLNPEGRPGQWRVASHDLRRYLGIETPSQN